MSLTSPVEAARSLRRINNEAASLRLTPLDGDEVEAECFRAAETGRVRAADRLETQFRGFRIDATCQVVDAKVPTIFNISESLLADLDAVETVDRCLRSMDVAPNHFRFADGSRRPELPEVADHITDPGSEAGVHEIVPGAAAAALRREYTMVLNNLVPRSRGRLQDLVDDLTRVIGTPAQVNVYISEREAPGFGRHWDDHDVLILQCAGRKQWTIFEPTALSPRLGHTPNREFGPAYFTGVLEPGSALYIPRGWGHEVRGFADELSVHYTVGIRFQTMVDVIRFTIARREAEGHSVWRGDPLQGFPSLRLDRAEVDAAIADHRMRFSSLAGSGPLAVFGSAQRGHRSSRFYAPCPGGAVFADHPSVSTDEFALGARGSVMAIPRRAAGDVSALLRGDRLVVDNAVVEGRPIENQDVIEGLLETGIVALEVSDG